MALSLLGTKMIALDSDILKCNAYVEAQIIALDAQGETRHELLVNVFVRYEMVAQDDNSPLGLSIARKMLMMQE
jgi:hypothetical protein